MSIPVHPSPAADPVPVLPRFRDLAGQYDVVLSDVWGVIHNGIDHFRGAVDALARFRVQGGKVVLITNAPRPSPPIVEQLDSLGVPRDAWDALVTSGDVTLDLMMERAGAPVYFIGPPRDQAIFRQLEALGAHVPEQVPLAEAAYVLCSGMFDDFDHTPETYDEVYAAMIRDGKDMICANPDIVVHKGSQLLYCAGALAQRLEEKGGRAIYAGKPHKPIYDKCLSVARGLGAPGRPRVLAIGDAIHTDVAGAGAQGLDVLFVTRGIHRDALHPVDGVLDDEALQELMRAAPRLPVAAMPALVW